MAQIDYLLAAVVSGIALAGLWVFFFWFYGQYRIDKTRQELFSIRDELFDFAAQGKISFDHPAYILLRNTMNGMVRFTHRIDLISLLALIFFTRHSTLETCDFVSKFKEAMNTIPYTDIREKLEEFKMRMNSVIVGHFIKGSVLILTIVILLVIFVIVKHGIRNIFTKIAKMFPGINQIDTIAAELGHTS